MHTRGYWVVYNRIKRKHPNWSYKELHKVTTILYKG